MTDGMSARQERFVEEYLLDGNGKQAAIRAGYSEKTAESQASRLLRYAKVRDAIAFRQKKRAERLGISADRVLREYARIAFADIRDVVKVTPDGVRISPSGAWTEDDAATVSEIREDKEGNISLKMHSKTHALDMIGKHLGMFVERKEHTVRKIEDMTEAELLEFLGEDGEEETLN